MMDEREDEVLDMTNEEYLEALNKVLKNMDNRKLAYYYYYILEYEKE